jgi:hypothetical protein
LRFYQSAPPSPPCTPAVIRKSIERHGIQQLEMIGFDACLMGNWEALVGLQGLTRYVLASEEIEPGHGWDWKDFALLAKNPKVGGLP